MAMQSDTLLSEFVTRTSADAGLARDLLQCECLSLAAGEAAI